MTEQENHTTDTDEQDSVDVETPEQEAEETTEQESEDSAGGEHDDDAETFTRDYVEKLRKEAGDARVRVKDRDTLAARLHGALVAATGRLADPTDLPFDEAHLAEDGAALAAAVDELLARKPHLASRTPRGDVGQGATPGDGGGVDLAGILRSRAS